MTKAEAETLFKAIKRNAPAFRYGQHWDWTTLNLVYPQTCKALRQAVEVITGKPVTFRR